MPRSPVRLNAPPETLDGDPPLSTLLTHRLVAVTPDSIPLVAAEVMAASGVRHLPVLERGRCLGVLVEPDVVRALLSSVLGTVAALCRPAELLAPTDRRGAAAAAMQRSGLDVVLVVERGHLAGIVTATDLVRSLVPAPDERGTSGPGAAPPGPGSVTP